MAQTAVLAPPRRTEIEQATTLAGQPRWRTALVDVSCLIAPLALLALITLRVVAGGTLDYLTNHANPAFGHGDLYRYVNMALPNAATFWSHESPFLYRILVPLIVHGLILAGVPFRVSFFTITILSLALSAVLLFYLVRGAGLSRLEATFGALAFVTLQWAVAYNIHDYFLVDAATQCFIIGILLAVQRDKFPLAIALATIGVICNERVYLAIAVGVIQLLMPHVRPLSRTLGELLRLRVAGVVRQIPPRTWLTLLPLVGLPLIATSVIHFIQHPIDPPSIIGTWQAYIPMHFKHVGKLRGLETLLLVATFYTFGALFVTALGAFALRSWPRGRFSIWALVATLLIIAYSYTVSGDNQRLSVVGWPFVILYAAIALRTIAERLKVPVAVLWALVLASQFIFEPSLESTGVKLLSGTLRTMDLTYAINEMLLVSALVGVLILLSLLRQMAPTSALALAGAGGLTSVSQDALTTDGVAAERATGKVLVTRPVPVNTLPGDIDSAFWLGMRGGMVALADRCVWLARLRLRDLVAEPLLMLSARSLDIAPQTVSLDGLADPRLIEAVQRWQPASNELPALWHAYQTAIADYRDLRERLGVARSPLPDVEREAAAALEIGLRQMSEDFSTVITWKSVSIVLPAYNEELVIAQTTGDCLRAVRRFCPNAEVIVVDDGSRDRTGAIADELAARDARVVVVHNQPNKGYGGALLAGFAAARGDLLFFMDSDGQFNIDQIATLLTICAQKPGTVALGYRAHRRDPLVRRLNAWGWKQLVGLTLDLHGIRDIDCAFKMFPARLFRACDVRAQGAMVNTELLVKLQRMQVPIEQTPVEHFARTHGTATGANLKVIVKAFQELMRLRLRLHEWEPPPVY